MYIWVHFYMFVYLSGNQFHAWDHGTSGLDPWHHKGCGRTAVQCAPRRPTERLPTTGHLCKDYTRQAVHPLCSCLFSVPRCLWHNFFLIIWYFINSSGFKRCSFNIMKTPQNFYFKTPPPLPSWSEFNTRHYNRHGSTQIIILRNKTVFVLVFLCKSKNDNVSSRYPFHRFQVHIFYRYAYFH